MAQQQQQRQQQKIQDCRPMPFVSNTQFSNEVHEGPGSLPSPLSAGPGPIKSGSLSTRRHRYASEYHDHQTRRHLHHQQQQQQQAQNLTQGRYETEHQLPKPLSSQGQPQNTLLEPSGTQAHRLPSPISPTFVSGRRLSQQQQQQQQHNISPVSPRNVTGVFSPLLKVPFPNLTLTLALIYVDRLKAKYPEAKGEAGCSHRLFLVAYIIAEKYRCSVELATLLQEHHNHLTELELRGRDQSHTSSLENTTGPELDDAIEERILKVQSNAELIFSNHEWVRLLNLGSFFRPPPAPTASMPSSAAKATAGNMAGVARTSPAQPMVRSMPCPSGSIESEPLPLPIQSSPAVAVPGDTNTVTAANHNSVKNASLPSPAPSSAGTQGGTPMPTPKALPLQVPQTSILQVEDLDRMETEFLTFLDFDLSTRGQDLDTCWNLLVGNIQI
ncbi:hypothetical protein BGZ54_003971 [Gamsiella multidivaricata]|nr:hypothetical protein BGZ54_003971 [Gamsiella multidivaricata]